MTAIYYVHRASLLCGECAVLIDRDLAGRGKIPAGPYECGGPESEADSPQHCDQCGLFLRNSLTADGYRYVHRALKPGSGGRKEILDQWRQHYVEPAG